MSTRSIIVVTGSGQYGNQANPDKDTYRLYKHCDGYPTDNLPVIAESLAAVLADIKAAQRRWKDAVRHKILPEAVVGKLIGACTSEYGMGAQIDCDWRGDKRGPSAEYHEEFHPKHLGRQEDLEWIYIVDTDKKMVNVYGGGYTGQAPQAAYRRGTADPMSYVERMEDECKAKEAKEIKKAIADIEALGFRVNPEPKRRKPRSKLKQAAIDLKIVA